MNGRPRKQLDMVYSGHADEAEQWANHYFRCYLTYKHMGWELQEMRYYEYFLYFTGRRRFWLKELLRVQLKEFNHG